LNRRDDDAIVVVQMTQTGRIPEDARLSDAELREFLNRLFPHGVAGRDVMSEVAPDGWKRSPMLAAFHPSVEQVFKEELRWCRDFESQHNELRRDDDPKAEYVRVPRPKLRHVRRQWQPQPVRPGDELNELMGLCLWDVFSDGHVVVAGDGRAADFGPFCESSNFLDQYVGGEICSSGRKCFGFSWGTHTLAKRADLTGVFAMIFRRLRSAGAEWVYRGWADFVISHTRHEWASAPSPVEPVSRVANRKREEDDGRRRKVDTMIARAQEWIRNRPTPATVRGHRMAYGRDPRGWPVGLGGGERSLKSA
jgi:hypothetical protein